MGKWGGLRPLGVPKALDLQVLRWASAQRLAWSGAPLPSRRGTESLLQACAGFQAVPRKAMPGFLRQDGPP